jgi:hypothetical protein
MQRTGLQIHISPENRYSYSLDFFLSDISQTFNDGGLVGGHASLFLSKFFPLTVGFGYIYDFDQYSEVSANLKGNSNLEAREVDLDYSLINNNKIKLNKSVSRETFNDTNKGININNTNKLKLN